ncbi:oxidoreductase alpha (molybdopterin) subunit [Psychromonas ingrahamii 37]|uniref:Oxidoreductase alpha (Molybdopterin) subunit n=1 Tax=Psychromonas ingrahamii (strain DSM 17664 / CCUG 51855 / 37) TaxID=357804 RepID=A1SWK2_PSYIN|nr:FdhF/YdeP family oxidoreductase [Psychromonas ingrahamii]ABM03867.1 oxidoreductase alpha (molybdopterin) subunit [Psychromonas ingrahamii 37]
MTVKKYKGSAGGWGALLSTSKHLVKSENIAHNILNLLKTNQDKGFDCPGCAWGESTEKSRFRFCENGAKAVNWEATSRRVTPEFFQQHPVSWLTQQSDYFLESQGRLSHPVQYNCETDCYQAVSWQHAFTLIAKHLNALESPNQAEFYTSGRASNEAAFLYQLFVRKFGSNNFPDCSNMCHEATGIALKQSVGVGKGTVTMADFEDADAIFVFGQNPGTNHPRMLDTLRQASRRGAAIVTFNTLKERGLERFTNPQSVTEMLTNGSTQISQCYFRPKLGGDMAVVRGMVKALFVIEKAQLAAGCSPIFDHDFIEEHTQGIEQYLKAVEATPWNEITEQAGLSQSEIEEAAGIYRQSKRVIITWAMGITQHKHSVKTIQEITNLQLLFGQLGRPGAGLCPVRGHSNVQGDRTMGIDEKPSAAFIDNLSHAFDFQAPSKPGHNAVAAIKAMLAGESKVFIALGGNFAAATPDTSLTQQALSNCSLTVNIATKLNRTHLVLGKDSLILPCLGRTDIDIQVSGPQSITVEDSFSMVHASAGVVESDTYEMRSEPAIIAGIAAATLGKQPIDWPWVIEDYARIRDLIAKSIPGFTDMNTKIKQPGGFYLGNKAAERQWQTPSKKAQFMEHDLPLHLLPANLRELSKDPVFVLQTMRSHDQYNTSIYGFDDRYRGIFGERKVLFVNVNDITALGLKNSQLVDIESLWPDAVERKVFGFKLVAYDIPEGNIAAYFPETNPLMSIDGTGDLSDTPISKAIPVVLTATLLKSDKIDVVMT